MQKVAGMLMLAGTALALVIVSSCASIVKGTKHSLSVMSAPSQARVVVHRATAAGEGLQVYQGVTPATIKLSRKNEYVVTISLEGYKEVKVPVTHSGIEPWFFGNILCGGLIGLVVDYVDGAIYKMEPETINVSLEVASLPGHPANQLYVVFRALDAEGKVRAIAVPMMPDTL